LLEKFFNENAPMDILPVSSPAEEPSRPINCT